VRREDPFPRGEVRSTQGNLIELGDVDPGEAGGLKKEINAMLHRRGIVALSVVGGQ